MDGIDSGPMAVTEMYALKKAIEVQGQGIMKVLDSASAPAVQPNSGASITGIGQTLDLRA